jgi:biopolymer transport protein TolR
MARNFRRKHAAHPIADLNVTNLIDLGFMLLIIFMVATPLIQQEQKVSVDLPVESVAPQQKPDPKDRFETITLKADGAVLVHGQPFTTRQLSAELARFAAEPKPPIIQLRCDARATMQQIITVMEQLRKHDLTKIVFPTEVER